MTIEEKAKAYDEVLERVKPLYEWAKKDDSPMWSTYEYLFPQLVESQSKDERIRKALIDGVRQIRCKNGITQEQMLAYLEKQNDVPSRETTLGIWKLGNFWKENQVERDGLTQLQYIQKYLCLGLKNATIDYLKEQKPAEWSEEDKHNLNSVINLVHSTTVGAWGSCIGDRIENWLKNLSERFNLSIKQEWSEDIIRKAVKEVGLTQHQINWFKTNVFPPKQKWSEEDERMLSRCIKSVECSKQFADSETYKAAKDKEIAWLKALSLSLKKRNDDIAKLCSNEWSEEDKRKLDGIIQWLREYQKKFNPKYDSLSIENIESLIDWLKSFHPQPQKQLSIDKAIQWLDDTFYFLDNSSGRGRNCEITTHDFDSLEEMYDSFRKAVIVDC